MEPLESGEHVFEFSFETLSSRQSGEVRVVVREPSVGGIDRSLPMVLSASSRSPSLEDVWTGRFYLEIDGPVGHLVRMSVDFHRADCETPLLRHRLPSLHLPVDPSAWHELLDAHLRRNPSAQNAYDAADLCVLVVDGVELGVREVRAEREWTPLRWVLRRAGDQHCLELRDDTGSLSAPRVVRYDFAYPDVEIPTDAGLLVNSECAGPEGGLYVC